MDNRPIGVFDSGLGGLSTARELMNLLPSESIEYLGDTGRVPYGSRSREIINLYARQDEKFLLQKNVKMIVAACGTVSSVAADTGNELPVPFLGVVDPAARAAAKATRIGRIGVTGTSTTIKSGSYEKALRKINPDFEVVSVDCPLLVPIVEQGYISPDDELTLIAAKRYLTKIRDFGVDTLILGCTHFPLISGTFRRIMGDDVTIISAGRAAALECVEMLKANDMLCDGSVPRTSRFYVTDRPDGFYKTADLFFNGGFDGEVSQVAIG